MTRESEAEVQQLIQHGATPRTARGIVAVIDGIAIQMGRLGFNISRVRRLMDAAADERSCSVAGGSDILRAAVVLLHACLEDYLRSLAAAYLRFASSTALNEVPLAGQGRERAEKFLLGALVPHRDLTVSEVIELSIQEHLERTTYNNPREIASLLENLGLNVETVRSHFADIGELTSRRHLIVHRADLVANASSSLDVGVIEDSVVRRWTDTVEEFAKAVTHQLSAARLIALLPKLAREAQAE